MMENKKLRIDVYLIGDKKPSYSTPLTKESDVDEFFTEMNNSDTIMELGDFYFAKNQFRCAKIVEEKEKKA